MIYLLLIFSFLLESSFSNLIPKSSFFIPLFFLTSLTLLYPYFKGSKSNFIITCFICGLLYDIILTNSLFINTISFLFISIFIILGYNYLNYSIFSSNILNVIVIIIYRLISYFFLCIISYIEFNELELLTSISSSLISNIIYGIILFIITKIISKIFNVRLCSAKI